MSLCGCIWWPLNPLTEEKTEPRPTSLVPTSVQLPSHQAFLPQHASRTDFRPKLPPQGQRLAASFLLSLNQETCLRSCRSVCLSCVSRALPGTQHGHSICTDWVSQGQEGGTCEHSTPIGKWSQEQALCQLFFLNYFILIDPNQQCVMASADQCRIWRT